MSPTSLYLTPKDSSRAPDIATVVATLADLEVIADPLGPAQFAAGDGFQRHVVFAGCSPYLVMHPPADGSRAFCHTVVHGPFAAARLITGPNSVKPRCRACRARFSDWRSRLAEWTAPGATANCQDCGAAMAVTDLDWRQHATGGRVLVELCNVFPGEATPSDTLMDRLAQATDMCWHYAWAASLPLGQNEVGHADSSD